MNKAVRYLNINNDILLTNIEKLIPLRKNGVDLNKYNKINYKINQHYFPH